MRRFLGAGAFVLFSLLVLALPFTFILPPGPPDAASPTVAAINEIYWVALAAAAVVFLLIEGALILFLFRFRRRPETPPEAEGPQVHGNTRLEVAWTVLPAVALVGLAIFTFVRAPSIQAVANGEDGMRVRVEAHQFYWQYEYPNGAITLDVLRLPVDRPVTLELASYDVVHSWWVPELAGKLDNIPPPGRTNELAFTPERTGRFDNGKCGEFCGIQHALMTTSVEVVGQDEFDAWLEETAAAPSGGRPTTPPARSATASKARATSARRSPATPRSWTSSSCARSSSRGRTPRDFRGICPRWGEVGPTTSTTPWSST